MAGRIREAAAKILTRELGFIVYPEDIKVATGHWRTSRFADVYRWELITRTNRGLSVWLGCWDRLGDFVRDAKINGCHIKDGEICIGTKPEARR